MCVPRRRLAGCGGFVFHVMNRSAKQLTLFDSPSEYQMFLTGARRGRHSVCPIRLLEDRVMPNHWHLLVWPERDDQLSRYMRWITGVHAQRWRRARGQSGKGAVYQGRYRWVGVQDGQHFDIARQYIRQNPVRARLVDVPDDWPWSSASCEPVDWAGPRLARCPRSLDGLTRMQSGRRWPARTDGPTDASQSAEGRLWRSEMEPGSRGPKLAYGCA